MAAIQFDIKEDIFYDYYNNSISYIIIPVDEFNIKLPVKYDTAILNCVYKNGNVNNGKYLSPLYRTITHVQHNTDFVILSIRP